MRARKDGPDAVGSCLTGPALTTPRIAPTFKMFVNSRVGVQDMSSSLMMNSYK
jgi:hypothetical protein